MFGASSVDADEFSRIFLRPQVVQTPNYFYVSHNNPIPPCPPCECQCSIHSNQGFYYHQDEYYQSHFSSQTPTKDSESEGDNDESMSSFEEYPEESDDSLGIELSEEENEPIITKWAEEDELMIELPKNNLIEYFNTFKILSDTIHSSVC